MKTFKINIPEGYEIDKDESTFEKIVFKKIEKKLITSWEELHSIKGYYVKGDSSIIKKGSGLKVSTDICNRVLSGESFTDVANDLNSKGLL